MADIRSRRTCYFAIAFAIEIAAAGLGVAPPASAETAAPAPVAYRRVFVPADNVKVWPRDGHNYLPVDAHELERWIATANQTASGTGPTARIVEAQYSARLEGDRLVDGKASWKIEARGGAPGFLPLRSPALAVHEAKWRDGPSRSVELGLFGATAGKRLEYGLAVPRSATLEFDWQAYPSDSAGGELEFALGLPPALRQRLVLDLPADRRPVLEGSVILESFDMDSKDTSSPGPWRRWVLAVPEASSARLRIEHELAELTTSLPTSSVQEELTYEIGPRGLELTARLRLDLAAQELRRLAVKLSEGVHLLSATSGDRELVWRVVDDPTADAALAIIELSPPGTDSHVEVVLRAWQPLETGKPWTLPTLRPDGVFWSSGTVEVAIDPLVELFELTPTDCVQTGVAAPESGSKPERLKFQSYSPAAGLVLVVSTSDEVGILPQASHAAEPKAGESAETLPRGIDGVEPAISDAPATAAAKNGEQAQLLSPDAEAVLETAPFASHVAIETICGVDGLAAHRVIYRLMHGGARSLEFRLPEGARLESAQLDGHEITLQTDGADPNTISISGLPIARQASTLTLRLQTQIDPLAGGATLEPPLPAAKLPLLAGTWTVWLPEEFATDAAPAAIAGHKFDPKSAAPSVGWRVYQASFVATRPNPLTISHPQSTTAWALATFLGATMVGLWFARRASYFVLAIATAAMLVLLLPASYMPLAQAAIWGLLAALALRATTRAHSRAVADSTWTELRTRPALSTTTVVLLLVLVRIASAQSPATTANPLAQPAIHTVLVPVGANGRPVGDKVYVSETFLRELLVRGAAPAGGDWLVRHASFTGELQDSPDQGPWTPGTWTMTFDIEILSREVVVELPLQRADAAWAAVASLDGIPAELEWHGDGKACAIKVAEPGHYQLKISFVPRVTTLAGRAQVQLDVPPLPGATFRLAVPRGTGGCLVPGHNVVRTTGQTSDAITSELAALDRLEVSWPGQQDPLPLDAGPSVSELIFLRATQDGLELEVKYMFDQDVGGPQALTLSADNRWELLADTAATSQGAPIVETGGAQTIRVEVPTETREQGEVRLRFRLRDAPALGRHRIPPIGLTAPAPTHRWLAVGSDSALDFEATPGEGTSAAATDEFLSAWGDSSAAPQLVIASPERLSAWELAVRPRAEKTKLNQVLHVAAGRRALQLQYVADVEPVGDPCYRLQLSVPADVVVDQIIAQTGDRELPLRWARAGEDPLSHLNVFFKQKIDQPYRLVLKGSLPLGANGQSTVPLISQATTEQTGPRVVLYQMPDAVVRWLGPQPIEAALAESDENPPDSWPAQKVGDYQLSGQTAEAALIAVKPRRAEKRAESAMEAEPSTHVPMTASVQQAAPVVRLVETYVLADAIGGQITVTRFALAPAGLAQCTLRLPAEQQLVYAAVDDRPVRLSQQVTGNRTIPLRWANLPQVLEVVTRSIDDDARAAAAAEIFLMRPTLLVDGKPMAVELSLWTLCYSGLADNTRAIDAATASAAELSALRLDRLAALAEAATESARRAPAPEGPAWFARWRARLATARGAALAKPHLANATEPSSQVAPSTDEQSTEALARVDLWLRQTQDAEVDLPVTQVREADAKFEEWSTAERIDGRWAYFVSGGESESLRVVLGATGPTPGQKRLAGLLAIVCVAGAAVWLVNRPASSDLLWRWPQTAGVLLGLVCWAWLSPAWIGLLVAGGSLVLMVGSGWPARIVHAEGSTVFGSSRR